MILGPAPTAPGLPVPADLFLIAVVVEGGLGLVVGTLFHGVLQNSLHRIASTGVAVGGTVFALGLIVGGGTAEPAGFVAGLIFAAVVGYAYDRTGNLAVPALGYVALNVLTLAGAFLLVQMAAG